MYKNLGMEHTNMHITCAIHVGACVQVLNPVVWLLLMCFFLKVRPASSIWLR